MNWFNQELPFSMLLSFHKLIEIYEEQLNGTDELLALRAKQILKAQQEYPALRNGFADMSLLQTYMEPIQVLLQDAFTPVLTHNEIKIATIPFENIVFTATNRFKNIIEEAGEDFELGIRNAPEGDMYILACSFILTSQYGVEAQFKSPMYFDVPDKNGIVRNYRILYNADFMELYPTDKAVDITDDDIALLLDNFHDLDLWKEKFPPNSWISKGFIIANMYDATLENAISELKTGLLSNRVEEIEFVTHYQKIFQSIFGIKDLRIGFVKFDEESYSFEKEYFKQLPSYLLKEKSVENCKACLCDEALKVLLEDHSYFSISDVDRAYELSKGAVEFRILKEQGIKSAILAPVVHEDKLLGVLELVATGKRQLNSMNANRLNDIIPYLVASVVRFKEEMNNRIEAIIQKECTAIHDSVYWKFEQEAKRFLKDSIAGKQTSFKEIVFGDVYPLYGQIDIKNSSDARNKAIQLDLIIQLSKIEAIFNEVIAQIKLPVYEEYLFRIKKYKESIKELLHTDSEQNILNFLKKEIHPELPRLSKASAKAKTMVESYRKIIDEKAEGIYEHRKNYDDTVTTINKRLAAILDKEQVEAQQMYPHYFERYKTDGVEHNMYIGETITREESFSKIYLYNLRLWQLQMMCEMENEYYNLLPELPVKMDVTSLVLVYNTSLAIRFRMDEKRFDVDGTYNARYEILKKRIDKALIKGTEKRVTEKGKIAIIYSQKSDEKEYLRYIKLLQAKNQLGEKVEIVELEDLQGVNGLKAIRVDVLYKKNLNEEKPHYTYEDLMNELRD